MENVKDFFRETPILSSMMMLLFFGLVFVFIDGLCYNKQSFNGIIVDKRYKAESNSIGTGIISSGNGSGIVTTVETNPEKFLVMVKTEFGKVYTAECDPFVYYSKKIGDSVVSHHNAGYFTGLIWSTNIDN